MFRLRQQVCRQLQADLNHAVRLNFLSLQQKSYVVELSNSLILIGQREINLIGNTALGFNQLPDIIDDKFGSRIKRIIAYARNAAAILRCR
ncbi:hypothetical protein SDC9_109757 [bioreactor metagenome]|uniref:Uncharacterized protein n=1 Tax=bioreactor metagenome TaxID=1076179 RepID=A0A645BBM7_9ZZZZ